MAPAPEKRTIQVTKNYRLFRLSDDNRELDVKKRRKLFNSMKVYGFLPCFPIVCVRDPKTKQLVVRDGQHRLHIAETLGLSVYWVDEKADFDVALINSTSKTWVLADYAKRYAKAGKGAYQEALDFAQQHGLSMGTAVALLSGVTSYSAVEYEFTGGDFTVSDRAWADAVAGIYGPLVQMSSAVKNSRFVEACMAACRVPDFNGQRLLQNAARCREKLLAYSTKEAYLDMLEDIYNYGRKLQVGLKAAAVMAMRSRNPAKPRGEEKKRGDKKNGRAVA